MGIAHHLLFLSPSTLYYLSINPTKTSVNPKFSSEFRCSFSSRPRRGPNPDPFRGEEFGFGRGVREKRRNWWSDGEDEDEDEDEDDDDEFGFWEEPSAIDWIFKILGAFGWMIPALIISALFGTGSNSLIMALVLPLGQTALSLVMDKLWGGPSSSPDPRPRPRPKPRPRRNPSAGSPNVSKESKGGARGPRSGTRQMNGSYKSWGGANSSSSATKSGSSKFGGWDELDELSNRGVPKEGRDRKAEGLGRENRIENVKLSMRRKRERPLFIRLLIAVFPFLGSWSRFLF